MTNWRKWKKKKVVLDTILMKTLLHQEASTWINRGIEYLEKD
jgi:hypothetical protein